MLRHYFTVPPACGMRGGTRRSEAAGGCFRRVWVLQGRSRVNIPPLFQDRPASVGAGSGRFTAVNEHVTTPQGLPAPAGFAPAGSDGPAGARPRSPSGGAFSWPLRFSAGPAAAAPQTFTWGCEWELVRKANREILLGLVSQHFIQKQRRSVCVSVPAQFTSSHIRHVHTARNKVVDMFMGHKVSL